MISPSKCFARSVPSCSQVGHRDDFRNRGDWDDSGSWQTGNWRGRIAASLPVSCSGLILLICVVVQLLSALFPGFVYGYLALHPANLMQQPWTIITHMFVHSNFDHLFWNMLFLFFFGMELERRVGEARFLQIYLLSGILAAVAQMTISSAGLVGASGALFGVMGCLAVIAPEIRVLVFFVIPLGIRAAVVLFALVDFLSIGSADSIAHMAHIAGVLVGLAYGYAMKKHLN